MNAKTGAMPKTGIPAIVLIYVLIVILFALVTLMLPSLVQPEYFYDNFASQQMPDPLRWDHFDKAQIQDGILILDSHGGLEGDRFIATRDQYMSGTLTFSARWADTNNSYAGLRAGYNGPTAIFQPVQDGIKVTAYNGTNVSETTATWANATQWHTYKIVLVSNGTAFSIDGRLVHNVPSESVSFTQPLNIFLHGYATTNRMEVKWVRMERSQN